MISANSALAAIDARRPGLKPAKKHLLLFFAQGHHSAHFGEPLFIGPVVAIDRGVTVPSATGLRVSEPDDEGALNTIGYVLERYGCLSPSDLRTLIRASEPWQSVQPGDAIEAATLREWFGRDDETDDPDDERPNRTERDQVAALLRCLPR